MTTQFQVISKISGQPNLVRPKVGGGVVNINENEYQRALARVRSTERSVQLENRVAGLENKLDQILLLLKGEK
jgi:hypothetical protein